MFDTQAVKEAFGRAAPVYDREAQLQKRVRGRCIALAEQCWPVGARILDAGCGTGQLAREAPHWHITGCDLAYGMCRVSSSPVINANVEALPFADESFDGIFSSLMLQWAGDPEAAWREMARMIKPGGRCVIATLADGTLGELREAFAVLDAAPHVSDFLPAHAVLTQAGHAGLTLLAAEQAQVVEYYPDAIALMRSLQAIGASNKAAARRRGMMTLRQLSRVDRAYERQFGQAQGLPATWQVLYLVLEKV
ncbi:MAG: methyltransferase domain-containing protein [Pseudomonadota bacterium]|nr:methyltransferase domain-containing protein [Pseudomonadota bacterium]